MFELNQQQKRERKRLRKLTQSLLRLLGLIGMVLFIRVLLNKRAHLHEGIRAFNKHLLNPVVLNIAGRRYCPYAVLYHIGRHSGKAYATPIVAQPTKHGFVIPLPYGESRLASQY